MQIELDYKPYSYQETIHNSEKRFHLIVGGRRVGKTKMAIMDLIKHCLEVPNAMAWFVGPTIAHAREVGWMEFKQYEEVLSPAIKAMHETLLRVEFLNGSMIYFKGADNERSLRGRGLTYLVIDEAAFITDPGIWTRALLPALLDRRGKALLISTPNGRNWFYDMFNKLNPEMWFVDVWPTIINPQYTDEDMRMFASQVSEMDFRQEFLAEFITKQGMVYDEFTYPILDSDGVVSDNGNILEGGHPNIHEWQVYLGIDFGFANPSAICFMAVDPRSHTVVMFDEIYKSHTKMDDLISMIVATLEKHGLKPHDVQAVYTDPAGNAAELSSGESPVDKLRMCDHRFWVINKGTEIAPGISLVRRFVRDSNGVRRFMVTKNCTEAIRSLFGYTYGEPARNNHTIKEEALKDGIHDHMCDAIRYFFVNQFDQNKWITERPEIYEYGKGQTTVLKVQKVCPGCHRPFLSSTPKDRPPYECKGCIDARI